MTDFPAKTRADWQARAQRELGTRALATLTRTSPEGIAIAPVYLPEDVASLAPAGLPGQLPYLRGRTSLGAGNAGAWRTMQDYHHTDPREANAAARADVERGASGCRFVLPIELRAGRGQAHGHELATLLAGIDPARVLIHLDAGLAAPALIDALEPWWDEHDLPSEAGAAVGGVVYDPLAALAETGALAGEVESALGDLVDRVLGTERGLLGFAGAVWHDAGASDADELALVLASAVELLRQGQAFELALADLLPRSVVTLAIGAEPFPAIAKLRAARLAWAKLALACGVSEGPSPWIHATPSRRMHTRRAPWNNLLRATHGCFAAALGGADSIATTPFDGERGSELGRRLALNTQVILREESSLDRVIDPAGGSFYVESLSDALARAAWRRFQAIEREGGLLAGLRAGTIQATLAAAADELRAKVATRKLAITGVSSWPALDDRPAPESSESSEAAPEPASAESREPVALAISPLVPLRLAAPFEALRDAADRWAAKVGRAPTIFAATIGPFAHHQPRLDFARNLFAAGGLALVETQAETQADALAEFRASGCVLAVVCGRDEDYPTAIGPLLRGLVEAGARELFVAGRPPREPWPDLPAVPLRHVYLGGDVLEPLELALRASTQTSTQASAQGDR